MEDFFTRYWPIVLGFINILLALVVALATSLAGVKFGHIKEHQAQQDARLDELEDDMSSLKGEGRVAATEMRNLSRLLERYVGEIREDMEKQRKENREEHQQIKMAINGKAIQT